MGRSGFDIDIPYAEYLGIRRVSVEPGHVTAALTIQAELQNSWHVAHGGSIMSLLDVTCGMSAKSLDSHANGATTVELKVNFLASATGEVIAEGYARKAGRSLVFVEGEVRDAAGHVLAKATGTFKLRYPTSHH
jgi:uncharacterized protein (TIGR00369 family)